GEGSAPNAAAIAETAHPVNQGLLQALGVFVDTLLICTCTAFIIIISGKYDCGKDGILLTAEAIESEVGSMGRYFITAAIFLFAYSTIIANYFYGETNLRFISDKKWTIQAFRIFSGCVVMLGSLVDIQTAFSLVDICMGLLTITNLVAIAALFPKVVYLLEDYKRQLRNGVEPEFNRSQMPDEELECWK
ncbi:MAG: alanine:cation symporter family protein, partial [Bacteroidaceae bacterium]|nr:alanine:cation symporter family protein [Bacteroidaceae bacterium]